MIQKRIYQTKYSKHRAPSKQATFVSRHTLRGHVLIVVLFSTISLSSWAAAAPQKEIHVTLLGQPCLLQGPFDESTLKLIHSFGPAQLYPTLSPLEYSRSREEAKSTLAKLRNSGGLPALFDRYKEKLIRRLDAQVAFLEGFEETRAPQAAKKPPSANLLTQIGRRYLQGQGLKSFETLTHKLIATKSMSPAYRELAEQLFEIFNDNIEKDPEEDFHHAIKKLNVQYMCSFEVESEEEPD